jgi:6-phospho-beta-glucosidase
MTIDRIAVIGGSSVYTPVLVLTLIARNLKAKEIVLIGRPGRKLELVGAFCQRLVRRSGFPVTVTPITDLEEGVRGARYVINHIRVGGMRARLRDEKIPLRFGMIGDESLGAGGIANALRTLPVVIGLAETLEKVNPEAVFINLSNPAGMIVEALGKLTRLRVVGACDLPGIYIRKIAEVLEVNLADIQVDYLGLHRMGWIQDVKREGRSVMSQLLDRLEERRDDGFDSDLIDLFRMIPTRALSYYFHQDEVLRQQKACARFRAEALWEAEREILRLYEDKNLAEVPELTRQRNAAWYQETLVPLIEALESDEGRDAIVCMRNGGAIRDLPEDCSVEVPARISRTACEARAVGSCPRFLRGLFLSVKESDRLAVEAVRHKSYEAALQALTINPFVPSLDAARKYLDRIVKEEGFELH